MDNATLALILMSAAIFLIFAGFLIWGFKSEQFKNSEEAKYILFKHKHVDRSTPNSACSKKENG
jgi:nitrogen fixation-related uncharacterized protein